MSRPSWGALALLLSGGLAVPCIAQQDVSYRVVVHVSNPIARLTREQASQIFLRKVTMWDNRKAVLPVDQPAKP